MRHELHLEQIYDILMTCQFSADMKLDSYGRKSNG